jgi:hypothetical protein
VALKTPEERVKAAYAAYELLWLLDLSKLVPGADEGIKQVLRATFVAGTLHGYAEANEDLRELERRMEQGP